MSARKSWNSPGGMKPGSCSSCSSGALSAVKLTSVLTPSRARAATATLSSGRIFVSTQLRAAATFRARSCVRVLKPSKSSTIRRTGFGTGIRTAPSSSATRCPAVVTSGAACGRTRTARSRVANGSR